MLDRAKALIEGGQTERMHTRRHNLPYSVAVHSWNMVALLEVLYPKAPVELIKACLFHDVAERWVGDMPAPAKWWICPVAGQALKEAEERVLHELGVDYCANLTAFDRCWLKGLDLLELYLWCRDETAMGNMNMGQVREACTKLLNEGWVPVPITEFTRQVAGGRWVTTSDRLGEI